MLRPLLLLIFFAIIQSCRAQVSSEPLPAAYRTQEYVEILKGKRIAIVANQTSTLRTSSENKYTHLVDSLLSLGLDVKKVFAPEHGFRGQLDAGEKVEDQKDSKTGLPIISLYGKNKKPSSEQLNGIDLVVFDIQDVGVRFYTYISTLHYIMEACAENNIPLVLLDRPNPNGHYIDGPTLEPKIKSFVGMHPVPVVYGMTIGEYGLMINGEKWLEKGLQCDLSVIKLEGYDHATPYDLPIKPSPNLPNSKSVNLYPSLCFFEGTTVSCGRGTEKQFQIFGSPDLPESIFEFTFTPEPNFGSKYPKHQGQLCYGRNLENTGRLNTINLDWLIEAYENCENKDSFFNDFFSKLAGTAELRTQIENGVSHDLIRQQWQEDIEAFKITRKKYLLYN